MGNLLGHSVTFNSLLLLRTWIVCSEATTHSCFKWTCYFQPAMHLSIIFAFTLPSIFSKISSICSQHPLHSGATSWEGFHWKCWTGSVLV